MNDFSDLSLLQAIDVRSLQVAGLAGCWKLDAGRAITLNPRERSVLEISQGRVWLAVGARPGQADQGTQDMVLVRGQSLVIEPGQQVVMESWYLRGGAPGAVAFCWDSVPATSPAADPALDWELGVAQPLRDWSARLARAGGPWGRRWPPPWAPAAGWSLAWCGLLCIG